MLLIYFQVGPVWKIKRRTAEYRIYCTPYGVKETTTKYAFLNVECLLIILYFKYIKLHR